MDVVCVIFVSRGGPMRPIHLPLCIRVLSAVLMAIFLTSIETQAQSQDSASPDLKEMKAKFQRLEQEMQELKRQIDALQQSRSSPELTTALSPSIAEKLQKEMVENKSMYDQYVVIML